MFQQLALNTIYSFKTTWPYASWRLSPRVAPQNQ